MSPFFETMLNVVKIVFEELFRPLSREEIQEREEENL